MAGDVRRLLDELSIARADYIGYSMGARIGLQAVLDFPDRLHRAVLGGIGVSGAAEDAAPIVRALRGGKPETVAALSFQRFASGRPTNDLEALAACMEGLAQSSALDWDRLAGVSTPILLVVGDEDAIAHEPERLAQKIPYARLLSIAGRDHMGTVPARQVKDAALEFLGEI